MAETKYPLTKDEWTQITSSNEYGFAYVKDQAAHGNVLVAHGTSSEEMSKSIATKVFIKSPVYSGEPIVPDDSTDLYFATSLIDSADLYVEKI